MTGRCWCNLNSCWLSCSISQSTFIIYYDFTNLNMWIADKQFQKRIFSFIICEYGFICAKLSPLWSCVGIFSECPALAITEVHILTGASLSCVPVVRHGCGQRVRHPRQLCCPKVRRAQLRCGFYHRDFVAWGDFRTDLPPLGGSAGYCLQCHVHTTNWLYWTQLKASVAEFYTNALS